MKSLVVIYSYMLQPEVDIEKEIFEGLDTDVVFVLNEEEFLQYIDKLTVLIVSNPDIGKDYIDKMVNCKCIVRRGVGYDNIDLKAAEEKNIAVCNVPDYCYPEVSDLAMALMLNLIRRVNLYDEDIKNNEWQIDSPTHLPLAKGMQNMTLGIVGLGHIGSEVARKGQPFFKEVIAYDPYVDPAEGESKNVKLVSKEELFKTADVVSLHVPRTKITQHMVNKEVLAMMQKGAYIINTARGPVINEEDLYEALKNGQIAGAGLDVMEVEPVDAKSPLLGLKNILLTPHIGFYSRDSFPEMRRKAAMEARRIIRNEALLHPVSAE